MDVACPSPAAATDVTPKGFVRDSWKDYTVRELGEWVHLHVQEAARRTDSKKADKSLKKAQNYLDMMQAQLTDAREKLGLT